MGCSRTRAARRGFATAVGRSASTAGRTATRSSCGSCAPPAPKYVVSSTLTDATWNNSTILRGDLSEEVERLRRDVPGSILVAGSGTLVGGLLARGLVDELRLMVFPVVLGSGRRLFTDTPQPAAMALAGTQTVGDGIVVLTYRRA